MLDYLKIEKIFIYCRVSTLKQADNIDEQYKLCFDWIKNNFNENILIDYYYDIKSTYNNENALTSQNNMLKKLNKNNLIVIKDISRLGRNEFQCINVLKKVKNKNAYIFSVEENLYYKAELKYLLIKKVERGLKEVAIDCPLFREGNVFKDEIKEFNKCNLPTTDLLNVEIKENNKKDYNLCPSKCDFTNCDYKCDDKLLITKYYDPNRGIYKKLEKNN